MCSRLQSPWKNYDIAISDLTAGGSLTLTTFFLDFLVHEIRDNVMTRNQNWNTPAVIFDMDGVLVDTEPLYVKVNQQVLQSFGIDMSVEEQLKFVGIASRDMWRTLRKRFGLSESVETLFQLEMDAVYHTLKTAPVLEPITGVIVLLEALRASGMRLAIASSSLRTTIELIVTRTGLAIYFDVLVGGDEVTQLKPNPEIFLAASQKLHVGPENCLVIEDSSHGIAAAKDAKMRCVAFQNPNSGSQDLSQADLVIENFSPQNVQKIFQCLRTYKN